MQIDDYIASEEFLLFQDAILRKNACRAVEHFLEAHTPVHKTQLHSIPAIIQAGGLAGLRNLVDNQKAKNTREANQRFWTFVFDLLFAIPVPEFSFRSLVQNELNDRGFLHDEASVSERPRQKQIRKANKYLVEMVMNHALAIYFEHFNCHYFYETRQGASL